MTLREVVAVTRLSGISYPEPLANLSICNIDNLCGIEVIDYLLSPKFKEDMDNAVLDVQDAMDHGVTDLFFYIDANGEEYELKVGSVPPIDCIDEYGQ